MRVCAAVRCWEAEPRFEMYPPFRLSYTLVYDILSMAPNENSSTVVYACDHVEKD